MKISIFGMGYVGCVSAGCLAEMGHDIVAVEPNPVKVQLVNSGQSPIIENGLPGLIKDAVSRGKLIASSDWMEAIGKTDIAIICVGTPSRSNGSADLSSVSRVCEQVGKALGNKTEYFTVVIRSTVFPGTVEEIVIPIVEKHSGKKAGVDFGVCMNPEFLREGTAIADFHAPPKTVIGELDSRSGDRLVTLYEKLEAPLIRTSLRVAEMVKYADNAFHAVKIAFANEVGNIAKAVHVDSHKVMEIFCKDTKLNISPAYLKPGFAFGGSCLPKDLRSISYQARANDISVPLLDSIMQSNKQQIWLLINKLLTFRGKRVGFLGMSFKEGTDDLRESPIVETIETLIGKGLAVRIFDENVSMAKLIGANKEYIEREIPHVSDLLVRSAEDLVQQSDVVVIALKDKSFTEAVRRAAPEKVVIDLVRLFNSQKDITAKYDGICW
jgi:GDP-mannose 6-dehydrogenase